MNRGSRTVFGLARQPHGASMRPRFMNRGRPPLRISELEAVTLQ